MSNAFSKEERVAFENILEGFEDALVLSRNVAIYNTDQTMMERTNNVIWRPQPYIAQSFDGTDQTANFQDMTQLSVPATIGYSKSVPWIMTALELRDALQEGRLGDSAKQKLASDINVALMTVAALQGTLFVKRTAAASGFDDVAAADQIFNEQGIQQFDRYLALSTRDYNGMASNLGGRQTLQVQDADRLREGVHRHGLVLRDLQAGLRQPASGSGRRGWHHHEHLSGRRQLLHPAGNLGRHHG